MKGTSPRNSPERPPLLIVAAIDPSGGAGALLDLEAAGAAGTRAVAAVSALTAQSAAGLVCASPTASAMFLKQLAALESDLGPFRVCKSGALGNVANARALAHWLGADTTHRKVRLILDPVTGASRGKARLTSGSLDAYRRALLQLAQRSYLVTPNLPEALWLLGKKKPVENFASEESRIALAREFLKKTGAYAVLLKGGHVQPQTGRAPSKVVDLLVTTDGKVKRFEHPRLQGKFHGTGCFLASVIAARLSLGDSLSAAVSHGEKLLAKAMRNAKPEGKARIKRLRAK